MKFYLDTNLIIAYYNPNDGNNQHEHSHTFFQRLHEYNTNHEIEIEICCSDFAITEFIVAYIRIPGIDDVETFRIVNELLRTKKVGNQYKFTMLDIEGFRDDYNFPDFFIDVQTVLLNTTPRPGIADAIHATIMKNNRINHIITFNQDDFQNIEDINVINPLTEIRIEEN